MSPVAYTWSPFSAKIFLKIWFCKIDPLLPPHIDFNTIPYFTYGCPYRGVKEGKLKTVPKMYLKQLCIGEKEKKRFCGNSEPIWKNGKNFAWREYSQNMNQTRKQGKFSGLKPNSRLNLGDRLKQLQSRLVQ